MRFFVSSAVKNLIAALSSFFLLMPACKAVSYAAYSSGNYSNSYAVLDTKESEVSLSDFGDEWYKENKVAMEEIAYHGYRFINPDVQSIKTILKAYFPNHQDYGNALAQYHAAVSQNNAKGIKGIMGWQIWDVCKAGGLDISSADGKNKCRTVAIALGRHYTPVCDKGSGNCVKNFKKINTQMRQGVYIAKAYAKSERNDTIACFKTAVPCVNPRSAGVAELSAAGSCLFCYSVYDPLVNLYEFSFSTLSESNDAVTATDIRAAMCALVGLDFEISIIAAGVGADSNLASFAPGPMRCLTKDSSLCAKVDNFAKEFGFNATYSAQYQGCVFSSNSVHSISEIINEYSGIIDNYVFSSGNAQTQIQASPSLDDSIRAYCENKLAPTPVTSFDCDKSHKRWIRGTYEDNEDILTCHINGKRVDFVFDDLTQTRAFWGETLIKGSIQGMGCIVNGGTFSGERCIGLGEKQCMLLREANLQECPECKAVYWEDETQSCVLPSSASASNLKKGINITLIVAGAVVGVVLTVATAGSATAVVLTGIETAGAAIEVTSQLKIDAIADDFLVKSNRCKDAACAKELIKENLRRLANFYNDMTATEVSAVDSELARLANLIPDDDEIWATMLMNGPGIADNQLGFFDADSWEPEEVWRAVGITLQLTGLVSSITSFLVKKSSNALTKSTAVIKQKFARAIQSIDNAPESTLRATRLELKQLAKNGKKVSNADDVIVVPKGQLAAEFHGYNTMETNTVVGIRTVGFSDEILFDIPSQYPKFNAVESFLNQNGYKIFSYLDNQAKAVYEFDVVPQDVGFIDELLQANGFRYSKKGNTFILTESDLAQSFPQYAHLENPIVSRIIQDTGGPQDINQILQDQSISVDDKLTYLDARAKYSKALSGTVQNTEIKKYASTMYNEFVDIIANDATLSKQIMNFDHLSDAEKMTFASNLTKKYNKTKGCTGLQCSYGVVDAADAHQLNGVIEFNSRTTKTLSRDQFLELLAHENNHWLDENVSGFLNQRQATIANNTVGGNALGDDIAYKSNLSEQVSYSISEEFSKHSIMDDILNKMPEHILMKLQ